MHFLCHRANEPNWVRKCSWVLLHRHYKHRSAPHPNASKPLTVRSEVQIRAFCSDLASIGSCGVTGIWLALTEGLGLGLLTDDTPNECDTRMKGIPALQARVRSECLNAVAKRAILGQIPGVQKHVFRASRTTPAFNCIFFLPQPVWTSFAYVEKEWIDLDMPVRY